MKWLKKLIGQTYNWFQKHPLQSLLPWPPLLSRLKSQIFQFLSTFAARGAHESYFHVTRYKWESLGRSFIPKQYEKAFRGWYCLLSALSYFFLLLRMSIYYLEGQQPSFNHENRNSYTQDSRQVRRSRILDDIISCCISLGLPSFGVIV